MTNDGLVSFKRVPGPDGETVVADLAEALPTPTDGGLTYAFQLRRGIRYSTGRPVRASDIRYGLERTYTVNAAYLPQASATLDSDFYRRDRRRTEMLGVPEVVPPEPRNRGGRRVGDDHVSSATPRSRLPRETRLARGGRGARQNPTKRLRSSSGARHRPVHDHPLQNQARRPRTQPVLPRVVARRATRRIPDRIVWRLYKKTRQAVSAVEHGTADWLYSRSWVSQAAAPRDRNQLRSPDPPIRLSRHRPTRN